MKSSLRQLERLWRHYQDAETSYDEVSLLDLSHSLRIWIELKTHLPSIAPAVETSKVFKTSSPHRNAMRQLRDQKYVLAYFPDGVITHASKGGIFSIPDIPNDLDFWSATRIASNGPAMQISQMHFASCQLHTSVTHKLLHPQIKRCNYSHWLGSEAIRVQFINPQSGTLDRAAITREMMVKRVANIMEGSHARADGDGGSNQFDDPIRYLSNVKCSNLPMPYFILLKIAQDILTKMPPLLGIAPYDVPTWGK